MKWIGQVVHGVKTNFSNDGEIYVIADDLYIEKSLTGKFYLIKKIELPVGSTLIYDDMTFSNAEGQFGLYIKLTKSASETPTVDVIIN